MSYIKRDHTALRDIAMKTFLKVVGLAASLSAASVAFSSYQLIIKIIIIKLLRSLCSTIKGEPMTQVK